MHTVKLQRRKKSNSVMSRLDQGPLDVRATGLAAGDHADRQECGLSRNYLTHLRQLVAMIERSVAEPDLRAGVLGWRPRSYQDFLTLSDTGDAASALRDYARVDPIIRRSFEAIVAAFDNLAAEAVRLLASPSADPGQALEEALRTMRMLLDRAATLVEDGDNLAAEAAGRRANRLYAR